MDLDDQTNISRLVEAQNSDNIVVLLGQPDPNSTAMFAETVTRGDPTWAGPLAGVPLGLPVYHILEPEIKAQISSELYDEHVALLELTVDVDAIINEVRRFREER